MGIKLYSTLKIERSPLYKSFIVYSGEYIEFSDCVTDIPYDQIAGEI